MIIPLQYTEIITKSNINSKLLWLIIVVHLKGKPESIKALDQITCIVVLVCNFLHPSKIF